MISKRIYNNIIQIYIFNVFVIRISRNHEINILSKVVCFKN